MLGVAAQRIVRTIRKPRNKADEAFAPKPEGTGLICQLRGRSAVAPLAHGGLPWASRRFVHLIPESRRRDHAGLIQRFLRTYAGRAAFPAADKWRTAPPTSPRWLRTLLGRVGALHRPAPVFVAGPVEGGELG